MNCQKCGSNLEDDSDIDTTVVDSESCVHNFKCSNESCGAHFEIEYHPVDIRELEDN